MLDPFSIMMMLNAAKGAAGAMGGQGQGQAAASPPPPPPSPPQSAGMSFNPSVDPTASAAATMTAAGVKPPTAVPDRNGSPMLPMISGGAMDSYYNDVPDPTQPLTAEGVKTPGQQLAQSLFSGMQDIQVPQTEAPRAPSPVSPPGPTVRPDMTALMQMITGAGRSVEPDPRKAGLAAMLMRG